MQGVPSTQRSCVSFQAATVSRVYLMSYVIMARNMWMMCEQSMNIDVSLIMMMVTHLELLLFPIIFLLKVLNILLAFLLITNGWSECTWDMPWYKIKTNNTLLTLHSFLTLCSSFCQFPSASSRALDELSAATSAALAVLFDSLLDWIEWECASVSLALLDSEDCSCFSPSSTFASNYDISFKIRLNSFL